MPDHKLYENMYIEKSSCPVDCNATSRPYYVNIPDDVTGIFTDIILPASLWPCGRRIL